MQKITIFNTPVITPIFRWIAWAYLKCIGWKLSGKLPDAKRYVAIAAPHTTNWDLPIMLALGYMLGAEIRWMGKKSLFPWPLGWLVKWFAGIPIDRSKSAGVVEQTIEALESAETVGLVIPPEGTRKKVHKWKSGFYYIAVGAEIPIVMGFLDYATHTGGYGPTLMPSGDYTADMARFREFYSTIEAKYPEKTSVGDTNIVDELRSRDLEGSPE